MASTLHLPPGPLTVDDLDGFPNDGRKYELDHGTLVVTPSPELPHQVVLAELHVVLHTAAPRSMRIVWDVDVVVSHDTVKVPDLLVIDDSHGRGKRVHLPPVLVVEAHSPSTKRMDLTVKRAAYAEFGVPSYWLVDVDEQTVTVLELEGDAYRERAVAKPAEPVTVERPFPVTIDPTTLFR